MGYLHCVDVDCIQLLRKLREPPIFRSLLSYIRRPVLNSMIWFSCCFRVLTDCAVYNHCFEFLSSNFILDSLQSGLYSLYFTETVQCKVSNDRFTGWISRPLLLPHPLLTSWLLLTLSIYSTCSLKILPFLGFHNLTPLTLSTFPFICAGSYKVLSSVSPACTPSISHHWIILSVHLASATAFALVNLNIFFHSSPDFPSVPMSQHAPLTCPYGCFRINLGLLWTNWVPELSSQIIFTPHIHLWSREYPVTRIHNLWSTFDSSLFFLLCYISRLYLELVLSSSVTLQRSDNLRQLEG